MQLVLSCLGHQISSACLGTCRLLESTPHPIDSFFSTDSAVSRHGRSAQSFQQDERCILESSALGMLAAVQSYEGWCPRQALTVPRCQLQVQASGPSTLPIPASAGPWHKRACLHQYWQTASSCSPGPCCSLGSDNSCTHLPTTNGKPMERDQKGIGQRAAFATLGIIAAQGSACQDAGSHAIVVHWGNHQHEG